MWIYLISNQESQFVSAFLSKFLQSNDLDNLIELTWKFELLLIFESFILLAIAKEHKLISAMFRYRDYLIEKEVEMTEIDSQYCEKRMKKNGINYKKGFWYNIRKDIKDSITLNRTKNEIWTSVQYTIYIFRIIKESAFLFH